MLHSSFVLTGIPYFGTVAGGISREKTIDSCEFYSVQSNEWITLAPLPVPIHGGGAALPNQVLCVVGGRTDQTIENRAWVSNSEVVYQQRLLKIRIL